MFQKRICTKIVSLLLVIGCLMSEPVLAEKQKEPEAQTLYSKSCAMVDGDSGRLLYGKEAQTALPNASTTKILTCIVAMEQCKPDEVVTFSAKAASQPKVHLGAKKGEQFYMQDLWYGLMLESYNDCAYAIAEHVAGSAEKFAALMNEKAKKIGCTDSHFVTPNGLDAKDEQGEHHTTAYDLCRIMSYCAWKSPVSKQFLEVTQTRSHTFQSLEGTGYAVSNKNALLDMMDHVITGKTGYTSKAGYCYVAALEEGGRHYAIALLACGWPNHKNYKWSDAKTLFQYGMDAYHLYRGSEASMELPDIHVYGWTDMAFPDYHVPLSRSAGEPARNAGSGSRGIAHRRIHDCHRTPAQHIPLPAPVRETYQYEVQNVCVLGRVARRGSHYLRYLSGSGRCAGSRCNLQHRVLHHHPLTRHPRYYCL